MFRFARAPQRDRRHSLEAFILPKEQQLKACRPFFGVSQTSRNPKNAGTNKERE
jgi:hypothetical protein